MDLKALEKAAAALSDIERIIDKINAAAPTLQLLKELGDKATVLPIEDRLIRRADAAKVLGVSKSTITPLVKQGYLKPMYVNSDQVRFWLSEVKALAKDKPWRIEEVGVKTNQIVIRELNEKNYPKRRLNSDFIDAKHDSF